MGSWLKTFDPAFLQSLQPFHTNRRANGTVEFRFFFGLRGNVCCDGFRALS